LPLPRADEIDTLASALQNHSIDILLNNAGVYLERTTPRTLGHIHYPNREETYRVNTLGAVRLTEAFDLNKTGHFLLL